jgi:hypothetical protein
MAKRAAAAKARLRDFVARFAPLEKHKALTDVTDSIM